MVDCSPAAATWVMECSFTKLPSESALWLSGGAGKDRSAWGILLCLGRDRQTEWHCLSFLGASPAPHSVLACYLCPPSLCKPAAGGIFHCLPKPCGDITLPSRSTSVGTVLLHMAWLHAFALLFHPLVILTHSRPGDGE